MTNIKEDIIRRRYKNGIKNLFELYMDIVDELLIFDNSFGIPRLIAEKVNQSPIKIIDKNTFNELKS